MFSGPAHDEAASLTKEHNSYSVLPLSHSQFSPNNSGETHIARPLGRDIGVCHEFDVWPKFYLQNYGTGCVILLYIELRYLESL